MLQLDCINPLFTAFHFTGQRIHSSENQQAQVDSKIGGKHGKTVHGAHIYSQHSCHITAPADQCHTSLHRDSLHGGTLHGVQMAPNVTAVPMASEASLGHHQSLATAQFQLISNNSKVESDPAVSGYGMAWPKMHLAAQSASHASERLPTAKDVPRRAVEKVKGLISTASFCILATSFHCIAVAGLQPLLPSCQP